MGNSGGNRATTLQEDESPPSSRASAFTRGPENGLRGDQQ
jgi:hypothetical protein